MRTVYDVSPKSVNSPITHRRYAARATAGAPSRVAKQVTKPIRNREAPGHRVAASMTVMDIAIHSTFLQHEDPDASPAFCRERPEVVPVVLLFLRAESG
jgi:hypothetical protein